MPLFTSLCAGVLFGLGLLISGMSDPAKVLGFLDLAGRWDPSLGLVMLGAVSVAAVAFRVARQRRTSLLGLEMHVPASRHLDSRLIGGSTLFGVGWGLAGYCPGPALTAMGSGAPDAAIFTAAMLAGMALFECLDHEPRGPRSA